MCGLDSDDQVQIAELIHRVRNKGSTRGDTHEALVVLESSEGLL
jgi:hypothetical protein